MYIEITLLHYYHGMNTKLYKYYTCVIFSIVYIIQRIKYIYIYSYSISMFTNTQELIQIEQDIRKHLLYYIILLAVLLNLLG